jgi:hypothetical protein
MEVWNFQWRGKRAGKTIELMYRIDRQFWMFRGPRSSGVDVRDAHAAKNSSVRPTNRRNTGMFCNCRYAKHPYKYVLGLYKSLQSVNNPITLSRFN